MTDNIAILEGYTLAVEAESKNTGYSLYLLVKPGTEFSARFRAWDTEDQDFTFVNGWMFVITSAEED